jgi:hypothetical protein
MFRWNGLKSVSLVAALATSGALTAANAQTTFDDVKQEAHALTKVIGDYTHDRRVALTEASRATLQGIDESILELNAKIRDDWDQMSDASKATAQAAMDDLHQRRLATAERLGALEQSSSSSWSDIRSGFSAAFTDLRLAWEKAKQEFDTD